MAGAKRKVPPDIGWARWEAGKMSSKYRYEIIMYWSEEDQAFIAEVPELPGWAADNGSYLEALANLERVIDEWIETAQELGRTIPEPKGQLLYA
jgi:predicted RNase H-like HicB family nuclease